MSDKYDLQLIVGSNTSIQLNATDSAGNYLNLSGYLARGQIRYGYGSPDVMFNLTPYVYVHPSYTSGIVIVNITGSTTTGLKIGVFPYDLEVVFSGNGVEQYVSKFLRGYCYIEPEVTR